MDGSVLKVGVLALQGAVREHIQMLESCGAQGVSVKRPSGLDGIDALVIPGGESTTMEKLMGAHGFIEPIRELCEEGFPIFGTCAGLVIMAKEIEGKHSDTLAVMDIGVRRNAFGRQVDSFEESIVVEGIPEEEEPFNAVFIRAPLVTSVGKGVEVMAKLDEDIVMVRQGRNLATSFHPELTSDRRIHEYFLEMVEGGERACSPSN